MSHSVITSIFARYLRGGKVTICPSLEQEKSISVFQITIIFTLIVFYVYIYKFVTMIIKISNKK